MDGNFNAFWDAIGIFHDVFEHYFEGKNRYFREEPYAFNVAGEIAAMGHLAYYYDTLGMYTRMDGSIYSPETRVVNSTTDMMYEAMVYGWCQYGSTLECKLPKQTDPESSFLDYVISEHIDKMNEYKQAELKGEEYEIAYAKGYAASVTDQKITDLYRWGYKQAEKLVPDTRENLLALHEFFAYWDEFTKNNDAQELANHYQHVEFTIKSGDELTWKCRFIRHDGTSVRHDLAVDKMYTYEY